MKDVKVLGPGCKRCVDNGRHGASAKPTSSACRDVEKVTDYAAIAGYGIAATPGIVIDGKVVHAGGCPRRTIWRVGSQRKTAPMLEYRVSARRIDSHGSLAATKDAQITLDTDVNGRPDAFNPAELFLAAIAACMIKGIERVTPMLRFDLRSVEVHLHGARQDSPPRMASVDYELIVDTDEDDRRLELLHENVRKYGTIFNTVAAATTLKGVIRRKT